MASTEMLRDAALIIFSVLVGWLAKSVSEWLRRVYSYVEEWSVYVNEHVDGVISAEAPGDVSYHLKATFFNRKSQAIGLHRVRFVFGTRQKVSIVNPSVDVYLVNDEGNQTPSTGNITLKPNTWTAIECFASTRRRDRARFANCTDAWLVAEMENGRQYRVRLPKTTDLTQFAQA